jgi:hypothetical protein
MLVKKVRTDYGKEEKRAELEAGEFILLEIG